MGCTASCERLGVLGVAIVEVIEYRESDSWVTKYLSNSATKMSTYKVQVMYLINKWIIKCDMNFTWRLLLRTNSLSYTTILQQ